MTWSWTKPWYKMPKIEKWMQAQTKKVGQVDFIWIVPTGNSSGRRRVGIGEIPELFPQYKTIPLLRNFTRLWGPYDKKKADYYFRPIPLHQYVSYVKKCQSTMSYEEIIPYSKGRVNINILCHSASHSLIKIPGRPAFSILIDQKRS